MKVSQHQDIQLSIFSSSEDLLEYFNQKLDGDLLFLDIKMPHEISGLELAQNIRDMNSDIAIVFVTNYDEYVYEGYTVNALRFLNKPVSDDDIFFCCSYVYNRLTPKPHNRISLFSNSVRITLEYSEILFIEAQSHSQYIYTVRAKEPIKVNIKLSDLMEMLPEKLFVFSHRSYIVNITYIRFLTRTRIVLSNNAEIPVSRTYANKLYDTFDNYFRGGTIRHGLDNI